jgi:hypothetical protein
MSCPAKILATTITLVVFDFYALLDLSNVGPGRIAQCPHPYAPPSLVLHTESITLLVGARSTSIISVESCIS